MTGLDYAQFDAQFDRFVESSTSTTVFRWEARQTYAVSREDPSLLAFRDGTPRPERSVRTSPWLARIARSVTVDGKQWQRVRYIEEPWTEYTAWEIESYRESQAAGDQVLLTTVPLARPRPDFWLFSGSAPGDRYAVVMHYDEEGVPQRFEFTDQPDRLGELHAAASEALASAVSLNAYLARHAVAGAR